MPILGQTVDRAETCSFFQMQDTTECMACLITFCVSLTLFYSNRGK